MRYMFYSALSFNGDLSKWNVSRATDMKGMFFSASSFDREISQWDVTRVTNMEDMFASASSFNSDISNWDVSRVSSMNYMFSNARSFNQKLCGADWSRSKASKYDIFQGSSGSISRTACTSAPTPVTDQNPHLYVSSGAMPERELVVRKPINTAVSTRSITSTIDRMITCPMCGLFRKAGRASCCAPGGAWFKNCGGLGNKNVDHKWSEGVKACERKSIFFMAK